jgi:N-carbamoyl-L-amino-acid hydrolase
MPGPAADRCIEQVDELTGGDHCGGARMGMLRSERVGRSAQRACIRPSMVRRNVMVPTVARIARNTPVVEGDAVRATGVALRRPDGSNVAVPARAACRTPRRRRHRHPHRRYRRSALPPCAAVAGLARRASKLHARRDGAEGASVPTRSRPMSAFEAMRVDGARLWGSLMELAEIGATPRGGVRRLALTDEDRAGRDLVTGWCRAAGLDVRIDRIGNVFARRAGSDASRAPVMSGSHIDTQPSGGKFDGNYGVLAALEVLRTLADHDVRTAAPLELAIWTNEEGTRFQPVMMGSGVFAGVFDLDATLARTDLDGKAVGDELARIGYAGATPVGGRPVGAYFEAHIEQGPILEDTDRVIGVVHGVMGLRWYDVVVTGQDAHAGPTPMHLRRDAMLAAARLTEAVNAIALAHAPHGRGTVGFVRVLPNSRNVIPGEVRLSVDLRHADAATLDAMEARLHAEADAIALHTRVELAITPASQFPPTVFDTGCVDEVRRQAQRLGCTHMDIVSGAGHDAVHVARLAPTAMIFVPCEGGLSHNEIENARPEHLEAGCNVLLHAMLARAA